ncbi:MAG: GntR family transcriptional regulator [Candidatus Omnitrophota bacterium]
MSRYLYAKVKNDIRKNIETGVFKEEEYLPSEKQLCEKYAVSRITVRRATAELARENLLIQQRGKGVLVKRRCYPSGSLTFLALLPLSVKTFFYDEFFGSVWKGMDEEANLFGYNLIFTTHSRYLKHKKELVDSIDPKRISGVLAVDVTHEVDLDALLDLHETVPVMLIDYADDNFSSVASDNVGGAFEAVQYLISLGHRKIACVTIPCFGNSYPLRVEGYRQALEVLHIRDVSVFSPDEVKVMGRGTREAERLGYEVCRKLLKEKAGITAIFAVSDGAALGVMKALQEQKIKVPGEISVIGFDGIADGRYSKPPLATMDVPKEKMGKLAVRGLIHMIRKPGTAPRHILLPPQLVTGGSVIRR